MKKKKETRADSVGGLVFVGSVTLGIGLGLFFGRPDVGVMSGLGIGFILFGIIKFLIKD